MDARGALLAGGRVFGTLESAAVAEIRSTVAGQTSVLFDQFTELLERANYLHLSHEDIEKALEETGDWGLDMDVDFDLFERLEVFARGMTTTSVVRRKWWKFFRK